MILETKLASADKVNSLRNTMNEIQSQWQKQEALMKIHLFVNLNQMLLKTDGK